ncbi:MAG: hypothetical protein HKN85_09675 [Gammaproteobacteria bacterium]|nr:hypothetical protein [Gammaproteobacteria bacterium]
MGCRYDWKDGQQTVQSGISMIRVYESEAAAAEWFAAATRNKTAEEMQDEMDQISRKMDQSEELNTELKKSAAKSLLAMVDSDAISFEDVAEVGDQARVSNDGTVYVRSNNMTFMVSAYKGATEPPLEMRGVEIKQVVKVAKESAKKWAIETAPQRKTDGVRLARAITKAL